MICTYRVQNSVILRSVGGNVVAQVNGVGHEPSLADLIGSVKVMLQAYDEGRLDKLYIVTNRFVNTMSQVPTIGGSAEPPSDDENLKKKTWDYLYEPDPKALLDSLYGATSKRWQPGRCGKPGQ
ncbi:F0F1 ATP synthase subunit gamma [Shigella flexneri]